MYDISQIRKGIANPYMIARELNNLFHTRLGSRHNPEGLEVFDADWDTLVILDGCRYDLFEARSELPGTLTKQYSQGSGTVEFLKANANGRDLRDTVYVTSNPMLYRFSEKIGANFHDVINVWQEDGWADEYRTVLPETMNDYARQAAEKYPNKRLVVHYIQPHYPFIGPFGREHFDFEELDIWPKILTDELDISDEDIWRAYAENFDIVAEHIEDLLTEISGKTVVTSDHGQMIGERAFPIPMREYGHPLGLYTDELVAVPWLEYTNGERRTVTAEAPAQATQDQDAVDDDVVAQRLRNLGYAE